MLRPSTTKLRSAKVFGIGFHKTGTSSLGKALEKLGFRVTGTFGIHDSDIGENAIDFALERAQHFDAFEDNPWPLLYKELDAQFPGSKFILTIRDTKAWMRSVSGHFGAEETPMRTWIYGIGSPLGNEARYVEVYEAHNAAVRAYFDGRPDDLLVLDLPAGDGWPQLCGFLGLEVLQEPFVHINRARSIDTYLRRILRWCKRTRLRGATPHDHAGPSPHS